MWVDKNGRRHVSGGHLHKRGNGQLRITFDKPVVHPLARAPEESEEDARAIRNARKRARKQRPEARATTVQTETVGALEALVESTEPETPKPRWMRRGEQ